MLTPNYATNPGILHKPGDPLFTARYARSVKFIPCSMPIISSVTHTVTLLDVLQKRLIAGFTRGWTTCTPSNKTAGGSFK